MKNEVTSAEVIKVLKAAKRRIETKGWCKGDYRKDSKVCSIGAIADFGPGYVPSDAELFSTLALGSVVDAPEDAWCHVPLINVWNDAPERTKADVLKAFDAAITLAGI